MLGDITRGCSTECCIICVVRWQDIKESELVSNRGEQTVTVWIYL